MFNFHVKDLTSLLTRKQISEDDLINKLDKIRFEETISRQSSIKTANRAAKTIAENFTEKNSPKVSLYKKTFSKRDSSVSQSGTTTVSSPNGRFRANSERYEKVENDACIILKSADQQDKFSSINNKSKFLERMESYEYMKSVKDETRKNLSKETETKSSHHSSTNSLSFNRSLFIQKLYQKEIFRKGIREQLAMEKEQKQVEEMKECIFNP